MLNFFESFQKVQIPEGLKGEIYSSDFVQLEYLETFSKINVFIGANNSGKSKFIRELVRIEPYKYYSTTNWLIITNLLSSFFDFADAQLREVCKEGGNFVISNNVNGVIVDTERYTELKEALIRPQGNYDVVNTIEVLERVFITPVSSYHNGAMYSVRGKQTYEKHLENWQRDDILQRFKIISTEAEEVCKKLLHFHFTSEIVNRTYIPSIRSLRPFAANANLKEATKNEYKFDDSVQIHNGQDIADEVHKLTNSPYRDKYRLIQFKKLLSKEFFDSKEVELTYDSKEKVLLIKIGEEMERPIHELGDGLQMIVILTFPFFSNQSGIVAIEEPELFLHPALQKAFVKFLLSNSVTKNFQIYLATHSNHIIDLINQSEFVSLFSIKKFEKPEEAGIEKIPNFIVENLAFGNENFLNLLGISNTSVYIANCSIWVEGITDKIYIQKYISEYLKKVTVDSKYFLCKNYKEGINYSFSLTGGDSIIHWDFSDDSEYFENTKKIIVRKFCSKSLIIVDNDFGKNQERKRILQELLQERFIELELPEIENLLSLRVIEKTLLTYSTVKNAMDGKKFPIITDRDFRTKKIGYLIDNILLKDEPSVKLFSENQKSNSSLKSGDKFIFCNKALVFIEEESLTSAAKKLVEQILDFVISRN